MNDQQPAAINATNTSHFQTSSTTFTPNASRHKRERRLYSTFAREVLPANVE